MRLRPGTLYAALDRMVGDGWLEHAVEEVVEGRNRRYYQITEQGIEVLGQETVRLEKNATTARRQLAIRFEAGTA